MPRPHRHDSPGSWYHVINRGADRQDIFSCDADYAFFETLMADAVATHQIEVHAYALMSNHFHLLLHCPEAGLSSAMKDIQSVYVGSYNHHHGRSGPMFEGRFTSYSADSPSARHLTGRYIHRNPLDIVPANALSRYRWSSYRNYVSDVLAPGWLSTHELDAQFDCRSEHEQYVLTRQPFDDQADRHGSPAGLGDLFDFDDGVAAICGVRPSDLRTRNDRNAPRLLAITLAVERRALPSEALADHYDLASAGSVRAIARRGRVRLADDPGFAALRQAVLDRRFGHTVAKGA